MAKVAVKHVSYTTDTFFDFNVYTETDKYSFIHIDISDSPLFYNKIFDHFFNKDRLVQYIENMSNLKFNPSNKHYAMLYKHLGLYEDDYNLKIEKSKLEEEVIKILKDEYTLEDDGDGYLKINLDKMGRMGEYIFSCLLSEYFSFDCIIPKVHLTTDPNMSVFGIDTLFYSSKEKMLLFGESKLSKNINNGIALAKKSLKDYERQISCRTAN